MSTKCIALLKMNFTLPHIYLTVEHVCLCLGISKLSSSIKVECILFFLVNPQKQHTKPVAIIQTIRNIVPTPAITPTMAKKIYSILLVVVVVLAIVGSVKLSRVNKIKNKVTLLLFYY